MSDQTDKKTKPQDAKAEPQAAPETPEVVAPSEGNIVEPKKESLPPSAITSIPPPSDTQVVSPVTDQEKSPAEVVTKEVAADYNAEDLAVPPAEPSHKFAHFKLVAIVAVLLVLGALTAFYFKPLSSLLTKSQNPAQKVASHILIAENETPTVNEVSDPSKVEIQSFSSKAIEKDQILIYQKAQMAVLYRPSIDKIIAISQDLSGNSQAEVSEVGESEDDNSQNPTFVILNGTSTGGLAKKYQETVKQTIEGSEVTSVGDASTKGVEKTFVVALSGQPSANIATKLEIETGDLPDGETKPDADFLIILGDDKSGI